ncbi:MAG: AI-2E family transporter [Mariprofundaceae bacterium]|nr:AI-2E family transporter [Mariprofundaceae bacterium]
MLEDRSWQWWMNVALFGLAAASILWLLSGVAGPLLLAWLMAYLLVPLVGWLDAHGIPRNIATPMVFLLGLIATVAGIVLLLPPLITQMIHFMQALPEAVTHITDQWAPWLMQQFGLDVAGDLDRWSLWLREQVSGLQMESLSPWAHIGLSAVKNILGTILGLFKVILVPLFAFYLLYDWDKIGAALTARLPRGSSQLILRLTGEIDAMISAFLRGQFSICLMLAVVYCIGLSLVGIPFALAIGLLSGLLAFIPYVGLISGFGAAALMAVWTFGVDAHLLGVLAVFTAVHLLEAFYLAPKVLGDKLGLHPLVILLALTIAAERFGFSGLLIAVPVTAAATVLLREIDRRYRDGQQTDSV